MSKRLGLIFLFLSLAGLAFAVPNVTLNSPINFYNSSTPYITFSCTVFDDYNVTNTTLHGSWGRAWHNLSTNGTTVNNTQMNFTINITRDFVNQTDELLTGLNLGIGSGQDVTTVNGSEFWILDNTLDNVLHINRTGGLITNYSLSQFIFNSRGITTNGTDFWITELGSGGATFWVLHFNFTFAYIDNFSTSAFGSQNPNAITTVNGSEFWIVDAQNDTVYRVNRTGGLIATYLNETPNPVWHGIDTVDGSEFWLFDNVGTAGSPPRYIVHTNSTFGRIQLINLTQFYSGTISTGGGLTTTNGLDFWIANVQNDALHHIAATKDGTYQWTCMGVNETNGITFSSNFTITVDTKTPNLTIISPLNITYNGSKSVSLQVDSDEFANVTWLYSLNGGRTNVTFTPNTTIQGTEKNNTLTVYVNDSAGNTNSTSVTFSIGLMAPLNVTFASAMTGNNSVTLNDYIFVNVSFVEDFPDACRLEWNNGTWNNFTMTRVGNSCYQNITNQVNGIWNFTVYVNDTSNVSGNSTLRFIQMLALPNLSARELTGRVGSTFITVNAFNGDKTGSFYVEYGTSSAEPGGYSTNSTILRNLGNDTIFEVNLTSLTENTRYYYRLRANDSGDTLFGASEEHSFITRRPAASTFNFSMFSDSHIMYTSDTQFDVAVSIIKNIDLQRPDFVLALGDNIIHGDADAVNSAPAINQTNVTGVYRKFRNALRHLNGSALFSVIGNWEGELGWNETSTNITRPVRMDYLPNPDNTTYGEAGSIHENYYAFNWSDALFVVLDVQTYTTNRSAALGLVGSENWTLGQAQLDWFNTTIRNSNKKWKFVFIHHTVGGNGSNAANTNYGRGGGRAARVGEQSSVHQIMLENGVDALFYGHDHTFVDMIVDRIHYTGVGRSGHTSHFFITGGYSTDANVLANYTGFGHSTVYVDANNVNVSWYNSTDAGTNTLFYSFIIDGQAPNASLSLPSSVTAGSSITINCTVSDNVNSSSQLTKTLTITKPSAASASATCDSAFTDTSSTGTYTVSLNVSDSNLNSRVTTATFTSNAASSDTPSSSSSGGGGTPVLTGTYSWTSLSPDSGINLNLNNTSLDLLYLKVDVNTQVNNVRLKFYSLSQAPSYIISNASGVLYKYFEINETGINDSVVESAELTFRVAKTWISTNNIDRNAVKLYRYSNGWQALQTSLIDENSEYVNYRAVSPGLSVYAVTGEITLACQQGETRCSGTSVEICQNNTWVNSETCEFGCSNGACNSETQQPICTENEMRCSGNNLEICSNNNWTLQQTCKYGCAENKCVEQQEPIKIDPVVYVVIAVAAILAVIAFYWKKIRTGNGIYGEYKKSKKN